MDSNPTPTTALGSNNPRRDLEPTLTSPPRVAIETPYAALESMSTQEGPFLVVLRCHALALHHHRGGRVSEAGGTRQRVYAAKACSFGPAPFGPVIGDRDEIAGPSRAGPGGPGETGWAEVVGLGSSRARLTTARAWPRGLPAWRAARCARTGSRRPRPRTARAGLAWRRSTGGPWLVASM